MQRCTNELYWMDQQAEERLNYDWSDANLGYPARKRQYEVAEGMATHTAYIHFESMHTKMDTAKKIKHDFQLT